MSWGKCYTLNYTITSIESSDSFVDILKLKDLGYPMVIFNEGEKISLTRGGNY